MRAAGQLAAKALNHISQFIDADITTRQIDHECMRYIVIAHRFEIFVARDRAGWTIVTKDHSLSAQWVHTVLVTDHGHEILTAA